MPGRPFRIYNSVGVEVIDCSVKDTADHGFSTMGEKTEDIRYINCKVENVKWHCFAHAPASSEEIPKGNITYEHCAAVNAGYDHDNPSIRRGNGMAFDVHNIGLPVWIKGCVMINCAQIGKNSGGNKGDIYWDNNIFIHEPGIYFPGIVPIIQLGSPNGGTGYFTNNRVEVNVSESSSLFVNYGNSVIKGNTFINKDESVRWALFQQRDSSFSRIKDNVFEGFVLNGFSGCLFTVMDSMDSLTIENNELGKIDVGTSGRSLVSSFYNGQYRKIDDVFF